MKQNRESTPGSSGREPGIVALHGFTGDPADFSMLQQPGLLEHFSWLCPDLNAVHCPGQLKPLLLSAREQFEVPPFLLGYSMGGRLALLAATEAPGSWAGLILIGSSDGIREAEERESRLRQDSLLVASIRNHGVHAFIRKWQQHPIIRSQENIEASFRQAMLSRRLQRSPETLQAHLTAFSPGKLPWMGPYWADLPLPVLLCVGERDEKFRRINEALLTKKNKDTTLAIIPRAGHAAHLENPQAFSRAVEAFIRTVTATAPQSP